MAVGGDGMGRRRRNGMKLRIGLVGLGEGWQTRHRPALRMLHDRFDVRAVYGTVAKLVESCAADFQADPVDGYRALVSRADVEAVMILERSWLAWQPLLAACETGKAIYWACDLDFDPIRDAEVRRAIERSGVAFMAEFPRRFAPATLRLKELIATRLGPPRLIFCHSRLSGRLPSRHPATGHDHLQRNLVEAIDWCRYVVGREPDAVVGTGAVPAPGADYRSLNLYFAEPVTTAANRAAAPSPVVCQISCGSYISETWPEAVGFRPPSGMQICCQRGVAFIDLPNTLVWFDEAGRHLESLENETPVGELLLGRFHRAVTSLVRKLDDLDDAFGAAAILAAAEQSQHEGRRIDLKRPPPQRA